MSEHSPLADHAQPRPVASDVPESNRDVSAAPELPLVTFTRIESTTGPLTKSYHEEAGRIEKSAGLNFSAGTAVVVQCPLPMITANITEYQANIYGLPTLDPSDGTWTVTTKRQLEAQPNRPGVISRSRDCFSFGHEPGVLMLDHDADPESNPVDMPPEKLLEILTDLMPSMATAAVFSKPSASTGIHISGQPAPTIGSTGYRLYLVVQDPTDIPRFGGVLCKKLVLAGYLHIKLSRDGKCLVRTLIDGSVFQPERIDYCAPAILGPTLERCEMPVWQRPGDCLDTTLLQISAEEESRYEMLVASAKAQHKPAAERRQAEYIETEAANMVKAHSGLTLATAKARVRAALDTACLPQEWLVTLDDGTTVSVRDILAEPSRYDRLPCRDPMEPEYGKGVAMLFTDCSNPRIQTFAHGGRSYVLQRPGERVSDDPSLEAAARELAKMPVADYEKVRAARAKALGIRVSGLDTVVKEARKAIAEESRRQKQEDARRKRHETGRGNTEEAGCVDEINANHALAWLAGQVVLMKQVGNDWLPSNLNDLKRWYDNRCLSVPNPSGGAPLLLNPVDIWMKSTRRREYTGIEFRPGAETTPKILNLWGGWPVEPQHGDISPFLELMKNAVFGDAPELFEWGLDWLAHLFQKPAELPGKAILLQSGQGWGKNTWIDTIKPALGSAFLQVSSQKHLTGNFNAHLANKLLIHAAESVWGGDKSKVGPLKAMITDEDQAVEYKGKDVFTVRNYKRLILSSNEDWPVPMDKDDRRFVVSHCVQYYPDRHPFWADYRAWRGECGVARVLGFLLDRDISDFRPWERVSQNASAAADIKLLSADALTKWVHEVLTTGSPEELFVGVGPYGQKEIYYSGDWHRSIGAGYALAVRRTNFWETFDAWVRRTGTRHAPDTTHRKKKLKELIPSLSEKQVVEHGRTWCFCFPDLQQCRVEFATSLGVPVSALFAADEGAVDDEDPIV